MTTASILQPLFDTIWDRKKIPDDWSQGIIIRMSKKGALSECSNWRGITLLSIPSKILAKVIIKRLSLAVDLTFREEQAGFRRARGCIDHFFTLRNIIEQCTEWQRSLYVNKAFIGTAFGGFYECMESPPTSSGSSEVSTTTLPDLLVTVTSCSKSRRVSGRGVLCPQYVLTLSSTGSCGAPQRIRTWKT